MAHTAMDRPRPWTAPVQPVSTASPGFRTSTGSASTQPGSRYFWKWPEVRQVVARDQARTMALDRMLVTRAGGGPTSHPAHDVEGKWRAA